MLALKEHSASKSHKTAVKEAKHESAKEAWVLLSKEELEDDGVSTS